MSLINHKDVPIFIAVNSEGVYILDYTENVIFIITLIKIIILSLIIYKPFHFIYFSVYYWALNIKIFHGNLLNHLKKTMIIVYLVYFYNL